MKPENPNEEKKKLEVELVEMDITPDDTSISMTNASGFQRFFDF